MSTIQDELPAGDLRFLSGGGEMGRLMGEHDWMTSPLGVPETWEGSLRTIVGLMLTSKFPMFLAWGPQLAFLYNDAYVPVLGAKHPSALGSPFQAIWSEIWDDLVSLVDRALAGEASWLEDLPLTMNRYGFEEQTWFTFSYSPARDDDGAIVGLFCACTETTDKVLAMRKNAVERERLTQLFSQAPAFMALLAEPAHRFELANQAYLQLVGHRDILGLPVREALPEVADQGFFELLDQVYKSGEPFIGKQLPVQLQRRPFGAREQAYVDFVYQPTRDSAGEVRGIFVSGYDVTELRQTQDRLELAQRAGHIGAFEMHPDTRTIAVSAEFCRLWGIPVQDVLPLDQTLAAIHPEDRQRVLTGAAIIGPEAMGYLEYRIIRPDNGQLRWIARRAEAVRDEAQQVLRYAGVIYDITDRRQAEDQLRILNETLEERVAQRTADRDRMWRLSTDIMLVARFDGTIDAVNPAWTTNLGWAEYELIGRPLLDFVHPNDVAATLAEVGKLETGLTTLRFENRYRKRDGSFSWVSWTAVPDAGLIHGVGRIVDAEKEAQAELEHAQEALRQAQKMEAVGQLTGGIAHDFNNLLAGISGSLEIIERRLSEGRFDGLDRFISGAQTSTQRAAALTQRLLAFSRRQTLDPKPTDVNRLVFGMEDLISRTVGPAIKVEVVGAAGLWPAKVDVAQLESALLNLAINARDAMPDGGRLTIETANKWLDGRAARERDLMAGQYLSICVSDTGTGIPKEIAERIFDPFFTTKPIGQGTGLGLSMIHGFVRQSGGQIRVYSELDQGTTMCLYLPRYAGDLDDDAEEIKAQIAESGAGEVVLVIDDEPTVRMLIVETLCEAGYTPLEAEDGPSGLKVLQSGARIDLLITDVGLPGGMNGRQVADAARITRPGLKILFITGFAENAAIANGHLPPGMQVMTKPFVITELANRITDMIEGRVS